MKIFISTLILTGLINFTTAQDCDSAAILVTQVRAIDTDSNIPWEAPRHYTFYNPDCTAKNILLVHLVGTFGNPGNTLHFPSLAANNGFHVLSLKYENDLSAQTACNWSTDPDCHYKFRREIIEGQDLSPEIVVDSVNSINNRLLRLLQYMDLTYPAQNWGQYYSGNAINWSSIMISGHSQGGGHAAVIGISKPLVRVLMFASPNDYSSNFSQVAPWTNLPHVTEDSAYYSFNNIHDQVAQYNWQYTAAINFGEGSFGDTVNVDNVSCPYMNSHNLYTAIDSSTFNANHGMVVNDAQLVFDGNGKPVFETVWRYMLGIDCPTASIQNLFGEDQFTLYPNPANTFIKIKFTEQLIGEKLYIFNAQNQLIITVPVDKKELDISIQSFSPGIYFVRSGKQFSRFIVQ